MDLELADIYRPPFSDQTNAQFLLAMKDLAGRRRNLPHTHTIFRTGRGGGVLRLLGMCRWMGSYFHKWIDYNGVTFLVELLY